MRVPHPIARLAEISRDHIGARRDLVERAFRHDASLDEHGDLAARRRITAISWLTMTKVRPRARLSSSMSAINWSLITGLTPAKGSSSKIAGERGHHEAGGRLQQHALAPRQGLRRRIGEARQAGELEEARGFRLAFLGAPRASSRPRDGRDEIVGDREVAENAAHLEGTHQALPRDLVRQRPTRLSPASSTSPALGSITPVIRLTRVDFPRRSAR